MNVRALFFISLKNEKYSRKKFAYATNKYQFQKQTNCQILVDR